MRPARRPFLRQPAVRPAASPRAAHAAASALRARSQQSGAGAALLPHRIAIDPTSSWVVVSNSNADTALRRGARRTRCPPRSSCNTSNLGRRERRRRGRRLPATALAGKVITVQLQGSHGPGRRRHDTRAQRLLTIYTGSRDTNRLNAVALDSATGSLTCRTATDNIDCRDASLDLNRNAQVEGPFGIAAARVRSPVKGDDVGAILVSSLIPHVEEIPEAGSCSLSSRLAGLRAGRISSLLFSPLTVTDRVNGSGFGGGPASSSTTAPREAIVAGCFNAVRRRLRPVGEAVHLEVTGYRRERQQPPAVRARRRRQLGARPASTTSARRSIPRTPPACHRHRGRNHRRAQGCNMVTRLADTLVPRGLPADPAFAARGRVGDVP